MSEQRSTPAVAIGYLDPITRRFIPESISIARVEESVAGGHLVTSTVTSARSEKDHHDVIEVPAGASFADVLARLRDARSVVLRSLAGGN